MRPANGLSTRREFLQASAAATVSAAVPAANALDQHAPQQLRDDAFLGRQKERRKELWELLGDLPWEHNPGPAKLVSKEEQEDYTLERLVLDLNGVEPVPALLLIPRKRQEPAPGLLYIHWHGGMYDLGKEMLLKGVEVAPAYAPVCAQKGAIDSWCFGERKHEKNDHEGEENAFKLMLWKGQVLYGMMMFDEFRAMDYLASRAEVDNQRLGALGMSMGSTKAWWLAALDPRVKLCMDVCCLTDYEELVKEHGLQGHGIYYYVPAKIRGILRSWVAHYNKGRPHSSLGPGTPEPMPKPHLSQLHSRHRLPRDCQMTVEDILGGLHHEYQLEKCVT
jgi:Integrase core domain/Acetyl xylan esterase (AXE1)